MKYKMKAVASFTVDADSRAEAHIEAANRLIEADLAGFDLVSLDVASVSSDRPQMSTDFPGKPFGRGDTITVAPASDAPLTMDEKRADMIDDWSSA
jgi:hypothetical protein